MTRLSKIVYLKPLGGYKTSLRSDTLWGLLCWGIRHLHGEARLETFLSSYTEGSPEWIISSAFPYKQSNDEKILFFPKPFLPDVQEENADEKERLRIRKQLKKMGWIDKADFQGVLAGTLKQDYFQARAKEEPPSDIKKIAPIEHRSVSMHNKIDRLKLSTFQAPEGGQLFQTENVFWEDTTNPVVDAETTGLFFLADVDEKSWTLLESVLRFYRHFGMGGNRSIGSGFFEAETDDFELTESQEANALVNLSLFKPKEEDLQALDTQITEGSAFRYELEQRAGKTGFYPKRQAKDAHTFFKEGSILPLAALTLNGRFSGQPPMKDSTIEKTYTYGYGFMVKMKI